MSTYKTRATSRDAFIADQANRDAVLCTACGHTTDRDTAVSFGSLCAGCFRDYCREHQPPGPLPTMAERREIARRLGQKSEPKDPKGWAKALRQSEELGEHLSPLQKSSWRAALKQHLEPTE